MSEMAWIAAITAVGGFVGTPLVGFMVDQYGRKNSLLSLAVPQIVSYIFSIGFFNGFTNNIYHLFQLGLLLIMYAQNVYYLYVSRFLSGLTGGGVFIILPIISAEISENKCVKFENIIKWLKIKSHFFMFRCRGALSSLLVLMSNFGILLGFAAGHFLSYEAVPRFFMIISILFIAIYSFMPETPYYLIKINEIEAAKKSLMFYRNVKDSRPESIKLFEEEFTTLKANQLEATTNEAGNEKITLKDFGEFFFT